MSGRFVRRLDVHMESDAGAIGDTRDVIRVDKCRLPIVAKELQVIRPSPVSFRFVSALFRRNRSEEELVTLLRATVAPARPATRSEHDTEEIERLKRREPAAWSALFEREHPLVFRTVFSRVGDRTAAEDITGQVFLEAIEGVGRYRDQGRPIVAWLLGIARHRTLDYFRKRGRETGSAIEPSVAGPDSRLEVALTYLCRLTPEQREVMELRFVEDYSLEDVAGLTGRSVGAVKALQHRALARLRTMLTEQDR